MRTICTTTITGLVAALLLAGCADHATKRGEATQPAAQSSSRSASRATPAGTPANRARAGASSTAAAAADAQDTSGEPIGITACDDYLSSYRACHRAAQIYAPDQIEHHYELMHKSLLRDSKDPEIRPQLATRCNSLASTLRQALHGKACDMEPAAAGSTAP